MKSAQVIKLHLRTRKRRTITEGQAAPPGPRLLVYLHTIRSQSSIKRLPLDRADTTAETVNSTTSPKRPRIRATDSVVERSSRSGFRQC